MWTPGTPVTLDGTAQRLSATADLVKAIKFMPDPSNTQVVYWGNSALDPTTTPKTGVAGIVPYPTIDNTAPIDTIYETDAPNGIATGLIYVMGSAGQVLLWSFLQQ